MNTKEINQAAKEHAKSILGDDQFKKNKDAAESIATDFKAGATWYQKQGEESNPLEKLKENWSNLSDSEKGILGRPNFMCGQIARRMRELGFECNEKAEDEQALVIFTMLEFYKENGKEWAEKLKEYLTSNP